MSATRRDLSGSARLAFVVLIVLIVFGIVLIFVRIPHGSLFYSVLGLGIFAVLTMADFQRLRRTKGLGEARSHQASRDMEPMNAPIAAATCCGEEIMVRCRPGTVIGAGAPIREAAAAAAAGVS